MMFQQKKISACVGMLFGSVVISASVQAQVIPPEYGQKIGDVVVSASLVGTELKDMTQNT